MNKIRSVILTVAMGSALLSASLFMSSACYADDKTAAKGIVPASENPDSRGTIIHDAEYYIIEAQNGKAWAVEDGKLDKKLAELRKKYGAPPNIIHYMWDDQPVMSFGDPIYQKIRGYETPQLNKLAEEGMLFSRM